MSLASLPGATSGQRREKQGSSACVLRGDCLPGTTVLPALNAALRFCDRVDTQVLMNNAPFNVFQMHVLSLDVRQDGHADAFEDRAILCLRKHCCVLVCCAAGILYGTCTSSRLGSLASSGYFFRNSRVSSEVLNEFISMNRTLLSKVLRISITCFFRFFSRRAWTDEGF